MSKEIEELIELEKWDEARAVIRERLRKSPDDHWLFTRLGLTYYEQKQYRRSLYYTEKALAIAPDCPLVLWDYAGCLDMLKRTEEAISVYGRIINSGINRIAFGECGEGKAWARGLIADCHYRLSCCYSDLDDLKKAVKELKMHLSLRGPGCRSIYNIQNIRKELQIFEKKMVGNQPSSKK